MMLERVLEYCNRLRPDDELVRDIFPGTFDIRDGEITPLSLADGQYFYIVGSLFNDGLHQNGDTERPLYAETFKGSVWALAVPPALVELAGEMEKWQKKYGEASSNPYTSESFGGYSYTKAANARVDNTVTVFYAFRERLSKWRVI